MKCLKDLHQRNPNPRDPKDLKSINQRWGNQDAGQVINLYLEKCPTQKEAVVKYNGV